MARIIVRAKRPGNPDLSIIDITDFKVQFDISLEKQIDGGAPEIVHTETFTPAAGPTPEPEPSPAGVIWDSNINGLWNSGAARTVTDKEGDTKPNGKGIFMAASGKPKLEIKGNGEADLVCQPGHGRFYICANNYNSMLELEFNIKSPGVDNLSLKSRSRHQAGGAPDNRPGGHGCSISLTEVDMKTEDYHNVHSNAKSKDLPTPLKVGQWYKVRFIVKDADDGKSTNFVCQLDTGDGFNAVLAHSNKKPRPSLLDKAAFDKESWLWVRMNNEETATIGLRNIKVTAI